MSKEALFADFLACTVHAFERLEALFALDGISARVVGENAHPFEPSERTIQRLKANPSWQLLCQLYDYAIEGVAGDEEPMSIVMNGSDVLKLLITEDRWPCEEWKNIVAMGDGRYALDEGQSVTLDKLALLANVDPRTVRNAVSAGSLIALKLESGVFIENASARAWLMGRKGFKPTVATAGLPCEIDNVRTPQAFAEFFQRRRKDKNAFTAFLNRSATQDMDLGQMLEAYPGLTDDVLKQVESGVFNLPLGLVWPLADFYGVKREDMLDCVMRVFFPEELLALTQRALSTPEQ